MDKREIQAEARERAKKIAKAAARESTRKAVNKHREAKRDGPARSKRPNGSIPEHIRKAERNGKVAKHRARKAGKSEEEAQEAYDASYKRALARYAREKNLDASELEAEAAEHTRKAGPGRVSQDDTPLCGALRTQGGEQLYNEDGSKVTCRQPAGYGTDHLGYGRCKFHGGNAPTHQIAAEREKIATEMIKREIAFYGEVMDIDPLTALAEEVRRCAGHVAWLGDEVRKLHRGELTQESAFGESPNILIKMYQEERDRLVSASKAAVSAGVAERTVQIAEQQGQMLAAVIRDILWDRELDLTPAQQQASGEIVRRHLMALDTTAREEPLQVLETG